MTIYERVNKEFEENSKGLSDIDVILKLMELERLDRIAQALEDINCTLTTISSSIELLEKLGDCVDTASGYGDRLIISGNIHV